MTEKEKPLTREDVLKMIEEHGGPEGLDLSGRNLEDIDLSELYLGSIDLHSATLTRANLVKTILASANLIGANLIAASLIGAELLFCRMQEADLFEANLQAAKIHRSSLQGADLRDANLEGALFSETNLQGANLGYTNLPGANLGTSKLSKAYLRGAEISKETVLEDVDWGPKYILGEEESGHFGSARDVYRILKQWHTQAGMYDIAGEFYFREMTAQRKAFWSGIVSIRPIAELVKLRWWRSLLRALLPKRPLHWAWSTILNMTCGYGERPLRVVASAAVLVFGLAGIYSASALTFPSALYHSAVSFTALGYGLGASTTHGWVKGLGAAEAFMGVFMMALFLITFIRKMTR